jgi:hypothetical protein
MDDCLETVKDRILLSASSSDEIIEERELVTMQPAE